MKKLLLLFLFLIPTGVLACMPPFPGEIMVGRISSLDQTQSSNLSIDFSSYDFPFRDYIYEKPTSWHWQNYSDTSYPPSIISGSLVIALSDYQDGSYPTNYSIFHITTLSCESNVIEIGKRYGSVMGWDRKNGKCGYEAKSLLDVFIDGDESAWIKKLQKKYPTCDILEKTFPIKQEISSNNTNILSLENNVVIYSTGFHWLDWILSRIDTFFGFF